MFKGYYGKKCKHATFLNVNENVKQLRWAEEK